jgi:Uncharacterised conserved protein
MAPLWGGRYTLDRLKYLYSDLLETIDVSGEELGRRRDAKTQGQHRSCEVDNDNPLRQVSLRDLLLASFPILERSRRRLSIGKKEWDNNGIEIAAAFRFLAATRSPDKEGEGGGAAAVRDDDYAYALAEAAKIERKVVNLIREIGEVVANGEKLSSSAIIHGSENLVCGPCFEYFCEKNILSLLVDIAKENPADQYKEKSVQHGVVWSPLVKAQVLQTVSLLVAVGQRARNSHALYYILSQNAVNDLMSCMLPLEQWTDPALDKLVPAFVDLIRNLGLLLAGNPDKDFFCFLARNEACTLLHAALEIGTSSYAQVDSFVHITCLSLVVNLMKLDNPAINTAFPEMRKLANHLSQLLLKRFNRISEQTQGPIVDGHRCNAVVIQLKALHDEIQVLNDVFSCGIPGLNVRLCEVLLRRVVKVLLKSILAPQERAFIDVGVSDLDVIPHRESQAQVALFFFAQLFHRIEYQPFVRMMAVALFHPQSTSLLIDEDVSRSFSPTDEDEYLIVPALDAIAQGKIVKDSIACDNPYRSSLLRTLKGDFGTWRFPVAAILVETVLRSEAMDVETLQALQLIPRSCGVIQTSDRLDDKEEKTPEETPSTACTYKPTAIEQALVDFLNKGPLTLSSTSKKCLECAGSLSLALLYKSVLGFNLGCHNSESFQLEISPLYAALVRTKAAFYKRALDSQQCLGVADIYLELVEAAIRSRYKKAEASYRSDTRIHGGQSPAPSYACHLALFGSAALVSSPENLVRRGRCVKYTDVEETRFSLDMAIHFRTLCKVIDRNLEDLTAETAVGSKNLVASTSNEVDLADDFAITFGGFGERPNIGMDLDLRGRMTFPCYLSANTRYTMASPRHEAILRQAESLVLVMDPTDLYVASTTGGNAETRGKIACRISLTDVIAAAADTEWLHIAVRHPDVGLLLKNGKRCSVFWFHFSFTFCFSD